METVTATAHYPTVEEKHQPHEWVATDAWFHLQCHKMNILYQLFKRKKGKMNYKENKTTSMSMMRRRQRRTIRRTKRWEIGYRLQQVKRDFTSTSTNNETHSLQTLFRQLRTLPDRIYKRVNPSFSCQHAGASTGPVICTEVISFVHFFVPLFVFTTSFKLTLL